MNAGLCISDLPPDVRDAEIERALTTMRKSLALYRVNSLLNALPANAEAVTPSGSFAAAGDFYQEQHA